MVLPGVDQHLLVAGAQRSAAARYIVYEEKILEEENSDGAGRVNEGTETDIADAGADNEWDPF